MKLLYMLVGKRFVIPNLFNYLHCCLIVYISPPKDINLQIDIVFKIIIEKMRQEN